MSLFVFGVNCKTAPVEIREKVALAPADLDQALHELTRDEQTNEALILSTCNRTEVYCDLASTDCSRHIQWLLDRCGDNRQQLRPFIFSYPQEKAVQHLLRVACGLDSLVLGEPQILGQLKLAYQSALSAGSAGKLLGRLFQYSFSVAKQVRTNTGIGNHPVSVALAAVRLAQQIFSDLSQHTALLIGAGDNIELVAQHLRSNRLGRMLIANRSLDRAKSLAAEVHAQAIALQAVPELLSETDIVIASTASPLPILGKGAIERAIKIRKHRPMFLLDLAVPRDIEPEVSVLDDVYLYTIDDLKGVIEENLHFRHLAARQADEMIAKEVQRFMHWLHSLDAVLTIRALRSKNEALREQTVEQARRQLAKGLDPSLVLDQLSKTLTNKLTHAPTESLRRASAQGRSEVLQIAQELFDLDEGFLDET
ncbi:MAG: glutamyl-tRNA reductase [Gammaproteobacteria bacterium]